MKNDSTEQRDERRRRRRNKEREGGRIGRREQRNSATDQKGKKYQKEQWRMEGRKTRIGKKG